MITDLYFENSKFHVRVTEYKNMNPARYKVMLFDKNVKNATSLDLDKIEKMSFNITNISNNYNYVYVKEDIRFNSQAWAKEFKYQDASSDSYAFVTEDLLFVILNYINRISKLDVFI